MDCECFLCVQITPVAMGVPLEIEERMVACLVQSHRCALCGDYLPKWELRRPSFMSTNGRQSARDKGCVTYDYYHSSNRTIGRV
jgi:hypothetical protein